MYRGALLWLRGASALALLASSHCRDSEPPSHDEAGVDARDSTADGASDASVDGARDAPQDAARDAGPPMDPLKGAGAPDLVSDGYRFVEGPVWRHAEGDLLFTDIDGDTIYRLRPPSGVEPFRAPSGRANGLAIDASGLLLAAEEGARRVSRTEADGSVATLAADYEGLRLNSPNDIAVRSDGTIYFTDPPFGIASDEQELDFNGIFRVTPDGKLLVAHADSLDARPNGIALSPDEDRLYVSDTARASVSVFDVEPDGSTEGPRPFVATDAQPDGMAIDREGNLYVTSTEGVEVFAPDGSKWGSVAVPRAPANCAFGGVDGRTLYITARDGLYAVRLAIPGW